MSYARTDLSGGGGRLASLPRQPNQIHGSESSVAYCGETADSRLALR